MAEQDADNSGLAEGRMTLIGHLTELRNRLGVALGVFLLLFLISVETAGLVIGSMILFLVMIFIVTQTISIRFFVIAVILPVALYGFFAHVASVAIPQGEWMQLP